MGKRTLSDEEMEDRGWRSEERRYKWTDGRGSPFQACVAKLLGYDPLDPASLRHILTLASTPHYAAILQSILNEARRDPGQDGFTRATGEAREVWDDVRREEPPNVGGRPPKHTEASDLRTSQALEEAIADALRVDSNATEEAALREYVRKHENRWLSEHKLAKRVRLLSDTLQRTRRRYGENYDFLVKPIPGKQGQKTPPK